MTWRTRLKQIIDQTPGVTPHSLAKAAGLNPSTVRDNLRGTSPSIDNLQKICDVLGISLATLVGDEQPELQLPIVGFASAGEGWEPVDGTHPEHFSLSLGPGDHITIEVRGHSMTPVYRDGDILVGARRFGPDFQDVIGLDCIVLTHSGAGYLKTLRRGTLLHRYTLRSYNPMADDIEDVRLHWVAPVKFIARSKR